MANKTLALARNRKLSPLEAVKALDQEIGGITSAVWNPGASNYKIINHNKMIEVPMRGANKKQKEALQEVVTLAYWQAQNNGSLKPGEVHAGKGCSTKHYKAGFQEYLSGLLAKYH